MDAFLRAVLAAPDDDAPRLAYADWLDERGDLRGEFVRLQCWLARMADTQAPTERPSCRIAGWPALRPKESHLKRCRYCSWRRDNGPERVALAEQRVLHLWVVNHSQWLSADLDGVPARDFEIVGRGRGDGERLDAAVRLTDVGGLTYRRGFSDYATLSDRDLFKHGDGILARNPVRTVRLTHYPTLKVTDIAHDRLVRFTLTGGAGDSLVEGTAHEDYGHLAFHTGQLAGYFMGTVPLNRTLAHRLLGQQFPGVRILLPDDPA